MKFPELEMIRLASKKNVRVYIPSGQMGVAGPLTKENFERSMFGKYRIVFYGMNLHLYSRNNQTIGEVNQLDDRGANIILHPNEWANKEDEYGYKYLSDDSYGKTFRGLVSDASEVEVKMGLSSVIYRLSDD